MTELEAAFREYERVLKPGGRLLLLEVSRPSRRASRWLVRVYLQRVLPLILKLSTGDGHTGLLMKYYRDTIDRSLPARFSTRCGGRRFVDVERRLYRGIFGEYVAVRPAP